MKAHAGRSASTAHKHRCLTPFVEDYHFEPDGSDATLLRWTIAYKPRLAFKLARPVLPRVMMLMLTRAGHNLEHGRWFSTPTTNS
jgi:hypothetical protein